MCGITGIFYKQREDGPVGSAMVDMCDELFRRGPDSAGVALHGPRRHEGLLVRVDLERPALAVAEGEVIAAVESVTAVKDSTRTDRSHRLVVADDADGKLADLIEARVGGARVFSIGHAMEIIK